MVSPDEYSTLKKLLFPDIVTEQPDTHNDDDKIIDCRNDGHELVGDPGLIDSWMTKYNWNAAIRTKRLMMI